MLKTNYIHIIMIFMVVLLLSHRQASAQTRPAASQPARIDTTGSLIFPFKDEGAFDYPDKIEQRPLFLRRPANIERKVEYDPNTKQYIIYEKVGNTYYRLPKTMSLQEYVQYDFEQSIKDYWRTRRETERIEDSETGSLIPQLRIDSEAFTNIFGSNTIDIRPQGYVEVSFGYQSTFIDDKTRPVHLRRIPTFDFDQQINMSVTGKIGDKVDMRVNFNTEATFDYENKMNINYAGKEDEILRKIEAGNVSLPLNGTLIQGGTNLFGFKTEMQFGKLNLTTVISQHKGESQTIETEGGVQRTKFGPLKVSDYDENRHFFLSKYFRDNYDKSMAKSPVVLSNVSINKIEIWVTNKNQDFTGSRDIIAFVDLGEQEKHIYNKVPEFGPVLGTGYPHNTLPHNNANYLYEQIINFYSDIRTSSKAVVTLAPLSGQNFKNGQDWEKIDQARKLKENEYILNAKLGYISLSAPLNADEVLAVAYNYTFGDTTLQVGEFSSDGIDAPKTLVLKLLKGTNLSPGFPTWDLMMKNIYNIGAFDLSDSEFDFNIVYRNDSTNTYVNYLPEGNISETTLLRVMNLDNANSQLDYTKNGDGMFDFIPGYTVQRDRGRVIFPVLEPFGSHLRKMIDDPVLAEKYVFQALYDSSKTRAEQDIDRNKFFLTGSYKGSSGSEIILNNYNLAPGSVKVSSGGMILVENVHYTVDYNMGRVKIIDSGLLESGAPIRVSTESQEVFSMQRKTMIGTYASYALSNKLNLGGTMLYMNERPITTKVNYGEEPVSNLMLGLDFQFREQSQLLTDLVNYLPFVNSKVKSSISIEGEVAKLFPGQSKYTGKAVYIDDFEGVETAYTFTNYSGWYLASTPQGQDRLFPEASLVNDLAYGYNRAKLAWFYVDPLFNTISDPKLPAHLKADRDALSNHYTRTVLINEIFPGKQLPPGTPQQLTTLNLAYFPSYRGPYNYDANNIFPDGRLMNPDKRWGGIMRDIQTPNFEAANYEYIEFWMLDPFIYDKGSHRGGDLYFNLGSISEDILRDGRKAFENGLPASDLSEGVDTTVWGRVPTRQLLNQAFDNTEQSRQYQDIGLDGLNDESERIFFANFLERLRNVLSPEAFNQIEADPSSDNYQYFRGSQHDQAEASVLERYKNINNHERSSPTNTLSGESYSTSIKDQPDIEDINKDNTLSELEAYYQYRVSIRPESLKLGENYIVDKITRRVRLINGEFEDVDWYLFKIPIQNYDERVGNIYDFKSIRFMRMFMTDFSDSIILRMATLNLVRSDWRKVNYSLAEQGAIPSVNTDFTLSSINIEENGLRTPINYILPPGIEREDDVSNPQLIKMNEQSMLLRVHDLESGDAKGVYRNIGLDFRQYKRIKMDVHAEAIEGYPLADNELSLFIRLGSGEKNYYEYEIPLKLTPAPATRYNGDNLSDRYLVWPDENRLDIDLDAFPALKMKRDELIRRPGSTMSLNSIYEEIDESWGGGKNIIRVVGSPTLAEVDIVTIGIKNPMQNGTIPKSVEVWVNELRLSDFDRKGGWASSGRMSLRLADLGSLTFAGGTQSVGWGNIDQAISQRSLDDRYQFDLATNVQLGKLLPAKLGVQMPLFYSISQRVATPEYSPLSTDIKMKDALDLIDSPEERDALLDKAQDVTIRRSLNLNNISISPERKKQDRKPMPYDVENFSVSYSESEQLSHNIDIEKHLQRNRKGTFNYNYSTTSVPIEPFKKVEFLNKPVFRIIKDINFNFLPSMIAFRTDLNRNYSERLARNNTDISIAMPLNVQKDFLWNRYLDFRYAPFQALNIEFSNQNIARIDELEGPMDPLNDNYSEMQEEIYRNLWNLGRPVDYQHTINIRFTPPINKLPLLNWLASDVSYQGRYDWKAGPRLDEQDSLNLGNTATNGMTLNVGASAMFLTFYNSIPYLRDINNKYQSTSRMMGGRRQQMQQTQQAAQQSQNNSEQTKKVKYEEKGVAFKANVPKSIFHKLRTETVEVLVLNAQGDTIKGEINVVNGNRLNFKTDSSVTNVNVFVTGVKDVGESALKKTTDFTLRMLMAVRSVRASYNISGSTVLPGFLPEPYIFGGREYTPQVGVVGNLPSSIAPTIPFLMGWQEEKFGIDAANRGWVTKSSELNEPYLYRTKETYTFNVQAEPLPDLRIDINGTRSEAQNISSFLNYNPETGGFVVANRKESGNFDMSILTLKTAFRKSERLSGSGSQKSGLFEQFIGQNRAVIMRRLNEQRNFVEGQGYLGYQEFDPKYETNGYSETSTDVLIPAFLAAYTGIDPEKIPLTPFPGLKWVRPNWRLTYTGNPSAISWMKDYIYSLNIQHTYRSNYTVGQFETNLNHNPNNNSGFSWVRGQLDNMFIPKYDISSINIQESFAPLISIDVGFVNDFSVRFDIKKQRNLNLSFSNNQLTEMIKNELTLGLGYRFTGMDMIIKTRRKSQNVSNDVNLRYDLSYGNFKSTYRKIVEMEDQLFSGMKTLTMDFSADYMLSDRFTMKLFFKYNMNKPHMSNAYENRNTNFGLSFNFTIM